MFHFKQKASGFFTKVLMLFLVACFALWGVGDIVNKNGPKDVAQVGDQSVSIMDFKFEMELLKRSFGEHYNEELARSLNLYQVKLNELINRVLVNLETQHLGINVGDTTLAKSVAKESIFQNATGDFDKSIFKQVLRENNLSENEYLRKQRANIASDVLLETFSIHPALPAGLVDTLYKIKHEQRKVKLILIQEPPAVAGNLATDEALKKFYEEHKDQYVAPEYRTLSYIEVLPEDITKSIQIPRQEAFDIYQQNIKDYLLPQKRRVSQLLYGTKAEAENAYGMLRAGSKLEEVAAKIAPKNKDAIDLGLRFKTQLSTGADEVFNLEKNGFTAPIESAFGWHIFRVTEIEDERTSDFESVQKSIEDELRQSKANDKLSEMVERLEDALSGGGTLEAAAKATGLTLHTLAPIDANGRGTDTKELLSPMKYKELLTKAFALADKARSSVINVADGRHYVVQVTALQAPKPHAFEEVKGRVQSDFLYTHKQKALQAYANEVAANVGTLKEDALAAYLNAQKLGATLEVTVGRTGFPAGYSPEDKRFNESLPSDMLDQLFTLKNNGEGTRATFYGKAFIMARLVEKLPAPSADSEQGKQLMESLTNSLKEEHNNEVMSEFTRMLRGRYPVEVNTAVYEKITSMGKTDDVMTDVMGKSAPEQSPEPTKDTPAQQ